MQPNIFIEAINKVLDRYVLLSIFFACLSLVIAHLIFGEWGQIPALGNYALVPIFTCYFIFGAALFSFFQFWFSITLNKKWLKNLTEEEKKILKTLVTKRIIIPFNEIDPAELANPQSHVLALYLARLETLCDAFIIYRKNIGSTESPLIAFIMSKWSWDYLNKYPALLNFSLPQATQQVRVIAKPYTAPHP